MRDPDSITVVFRQWLANKLNVLPDKGSFWCIGCSLNGGRTLVIQTDDFQVIKDHVLEHGPDETLRLSSSVAKTEAERSN